MTPLLKPNEAATILAVSPRTTEDWRRLGNGPPYVKVGHLVRYKADDLEAWIEARTRRTRWRGGRIMRRDSHKAKQGQIYAVKWVEWYVDCAGCGDPGLILEMGLATTLRDAERILANDVAAEVGWERKKGLWYCPECKERSGDGSRNGC